MPSCDYASELLQIMCESKTLRPEKNSVNKVRLLTFVHCAEYVLHIRGISTAIPRPQISYDPIGMPPCRVLFVR